MYNVIFVYRRAWGHTDTTASEDHGYETLQPLRPHCCRRNAATRHVFPMKGVGLCVIILPCCLQIEVALNHHIRRGLETKYDDTVRFNWLMWVWYNLPALDVCTFFTSNALRSEAAICSQEILRLSWLFICHHGMRKQRGIMQFRWDQGETSSCWGGTKDGEEDE